MDEPKERSMAFRRFTCQVCGHVYDEALGDPAARIAPGTRWEDVPAGWTCPDCGVAKADFEMVAA
jgi:rubredoxin